MAMVNAKSMKRWADQFEELHGRPATFEDAQRKDLQLPDEETEDDE